MNALHRSDALLADWLRAEAEAPAPSGLAGEIRARTSRRRPRSRWLAIIHEVPVTAHLGPAQAGTRRLGWVATVLLLSVIAAVAVIVGSRVLQERRPVIETIAPDAGLERDSHHTVRLRDGRVLVVGGSNGFGIVADAAIVDPWTGDVKRVPMVEGRGWGLVTAMLDDGRVLVAGGFVATDASGGVDTTASAEVFDPATDTFSPVGEMGWARGPALVIKVFAPIALHLKDGRVLVVGGTTEQEMGRSYPRLGDIFDPATDTFSRSTNMPCVPRLQAGEEDSNGSTDRGVSGQEVRTADLLPDGRILMSCERWWNGREGRSRDPETPEQRFYVIDPESPRTEELTVMPGLVARTTALPDGSLLLWVKVGSERSPNGEERDRYSLARFDPGDRSSTDLAVEMTLGTAVGILGSGQVVLAGGYEPGSGEPDDRVRLLDPCTGDASTVATLASTRVDGTVTELDDRHLLLVGGQVGEDPDMYEPAPPEVVTLDVVPSPACTG